MPKFMEKQLKRAAASKGLKGEQADRYVYGAMNNMGAMHGSKETAKGREMEKKHERGSLTPAQAAKIRSKANRILGA